MNIIAFTLPDYLILRAAAQKTLEKQEALLRQSSGAVRKNILESIIDLDLAISRCNRRECSFTVIECGLLAEAVEYYRSILPISCGDAHRLIPLVLEKIEALRREVSEEDGEYSVAEALRGNLLFQMEVPPGPIQGNFILEG